MPVKKTLKNNLRKYILYCGLTIGVEINPFHREKTRSFDRYVFWLLTLTAYA